MVRDLRRPMGRPWIDRLCAWLDLIRSRRLLLRNRELRDGVDEARAQAEQMSYEARENGRRLVICAAPRSWHQMVVLKLAAVRSPLPQPGQPRVRELLSAQAPLSIPSTMSAIRSREIAGPQSH
jgi:hypothetical protein